MIKTRPHRPASSVSTTGATALKTVAACLTAAALLVAVSPADARAKTARVESSKNWSVMAPKDAAIRTCFAATIPIDTKASKKRYSRGDAFLMVATFPEQGVKEQVAVTMGFTMNAKKPITLRVDNRTFKMFADGAEAWLDSPNDDAAAAEAMRKGSKAWVTATSTRGTKITDEYSLVGFTAAQKRSREICG